VLEVLEREGIPVDIIAGTSIGALIGALYARRMNAGLIKKQALQLDMVSMTSLVDLAVPRGGFIGGRRVTNLLRRLIGDVEFDDLSIPLSCIATDIISGDEVVLNEGPVLEAVRASISIPVVFTVTKLQGRYLVDGGLVNPVPVSVVRAMGADIIIAVDVTPDKIERSQYLAKNKQKSKEPGILSDGADIIIHPSLAHINPGDFHRANESILQGELAAVDNLAHIKRCLKAVGI
jgi:NTE family protein